MRRIPITDLIGEVVERSWSENGTTIIWFRSHRRLFLIDTANEHRVEAYAP